MIYRYGLLLVYVMSFFVPASLPLNILEKNSGWEKLFPPTITKGDQIKVLINNKKSEVKDIIELPTYGKVYYPSYVQSLNKKS